MSFPEIQPTFADVKLITDLTQDWPQENSKLVEQFIGTALEAASAPDNAFLSFAERRCIFVDEPLEDAVWHRRTSSNEPRNAHKYVTFDRSLRAQAHMHAGDIVRANILQKFDRRNVSDAIKSALRADSRFGAVRISYDNHPNDIDYFLRMQGALLGALVSRRVFGPAPPVSVVSVPVQRAENWYTPY